ncbi:hypothetical protein DPMN_029267 [Dreissena polymorpha]|uniref:Uncharacterized protein n=1 Tax=Dreissena polymorpha TaxID=45954 RepID=A0A9D4LYE5_DREPO|nr:hypothetical protein DPMN_029267 [Dreissena polymorpha]
MADGGVCLHDGRRINRQQANGDEMPIIDLKFERLISRFERGIRRQWDRLLILDCFHENYQRTTTVEILRQAAHLLLKMEAIRDRLNCSTTQTDDILKVLQMTSPHRPVSLM